jgi:hypothetical protein
MTVLRRLLQVVAGVALVGAAVTQVPAMAAGVTAQPVVTVDDALDYEGYLACTVGMGNPVACGSTPANALRFYVRTSTRAAITVNWRLVPGSASAGSDYTGPTTGSVTIPYSNWGTSFTVPLVYDGFNEAATETFTVQLTGSSIPATISDTGTGTIRDGRQVPADCTVSQQPGEVMAMDCTGRPAGQVWRMQVYCFPFGRLVVNYGTTVTGNGRSWTDCGGAPIANPRFYAP